MSPDGHHAAEHEDPKTRFSRWFNSQLATRAWKPRDVRRRLDAVGANGRWKPPTISAWIEGTNRPSESACAYVALAFRVPIPEALAAAGYDDISEIWAREKSPNHDLEQLRLRFGDLPQAAQDEMERTYLAQVDHAMEYAALRGEQLRRESQQSEAGPYEGAHGS